MTVTDQREPVAGILRAMAADADVRGELVHAARAHSPDVARLGEHDTRRHVTAMVRAAGGWLGTLDRVDEQDFGAALGLGADRAAQGVPMTSVLRGVQAGLTRAVEITVDRSRSAGVPDRMLLTAVLRLKEYGDAVERHVINGYRAAERDVPAPGGGAARARLLRQVLVNGVLPAPRDLAGAELRPDGAYHCLVADTRDPGALRLPGRGIAAVVEGRLVGLLPCRPQDAVAGTVAGGVPPLAVVSPAVPLAGAGAAYHLCLRALRVGARGGRHGLLDLTDLAGETALAEQPVLGAYLSGRLLGALDPADDFHRQLALTALAFLDHGRRLDQAAAALFTHPNTVRYRLARLRQITGGSPADPASAGSPGPMPALHWWWALSTWLRPDAEPPFRPPS
ncbi:helix-turn-helix domain-containing protein [Streptomyces sp. MI02-7b]|uniref:PucR family transcriptional regulator n=1 Tax=Streptomyces sp. MI02-7b TaxID=462941 RepID=UPI0029AE8980|nr:helix-turn-helix domain-containing protein [Streptomyces sp. MI02-7b]MDX3072850.1 helix-turn-helix domain-containing protein [Streptomyces sp. MI02-7b]